MKVIKSIKSKCLSFSRNDSFRGKAFKIMLPLVLVGYIASGIYAMMNVYTISMNTISVKSDSDALKVNRIDIIDNILLEDGSYIKSDTVESYVRIRKDEGTWYIKDKNLLVVEATYKDLLNIFLPSFLYGVLIIVMSEYMYKENMLKCGKIFKILAVICSTYGLFIVYMMLEELVRW